MSLYHAVEFFSKFFDLYVEYPEIVLVSNAVRGLKYRDKKIICASENEFEETFVKLLKNLDVYFPGQINRIVRENQIELLEIFLKHFRDRVTDTELETGLHTAVRRSSLKMIKSLLRYDIDIWESEVMLAAIESKQLPILKLIIEKDKSILTKSNYLTYACHYGTLPMIKYMLSQGSDIKEIEEETWEELKKERPSIYKYLFSVI